MLYKRYVIAQHERGLLFRDRSLETILAPGVYRFFDPLNKIDLQRYDLTEPTFEHELEDVLLQEQKSAALCKAHFDVIELGEHEIGLEYRQGKLHGLLPPASKQFYWKGPIEFNVEAIDISANIRVEDNITALLHKPRTNYLVRDAKQYAVMAEIADYQTGLLIVDGELVETLKPGVHAFWKVRHNVEIERYDMRLREIDVVGQEILTKDKVSLRLNLVASYAVVDPVKARAEIGNFKDYLYRELQFGLRQAVGTRSLDELLTDKGSLDKVVFDYAVNKIVDQGVELRSVGVKDIILPGEMKTILNQVVEAEKAAQANVIKRREETAATRSLLNTAKLMDENPTGRIPIFWVNRRLTPEVNLPCFSAYSTVRLCNTPEALTSPRHFLDTKRCSALSTAG